MESNNYAMRNNNYEKENVSVEKLAKDLILGGVSPEELQDFCNELTNSYNKQKERIDKRTKMFDLMCEAVATFKDEYPFFTDEEIKKLRSLTKLKIIV